ncbi:MAG: hypothetical protein ACLPVY_01820 [Acidimicrobiia bacterium]
MSQPCRRDPGSVLGAEDTQLLRRRADERWSGGLDLFCELVALGKASEARVACAPRSSAAAMMACASRELAAAG